MKNHGFTHFSAGEVIFSIFTITFAIYGFICFLRKIFPSRTSTLDAVDTYEPVNTDIADYMKNLDLIWRTTAIGMIISSKVLGSLLKMEIK